MIVLTCLALVVAGYAPMLRAQEPPAPPRTFGIVEGYWRAEAADELGATWERMIFDWSRFQPQGPGDFQANVVRPEWLASARNGGREVVGVIINTPPWASASGLPSAAPDGLYAPYESPENLWAVFLRQLLSEDAARDIRHWIIWDAPDIQPGDPGQPATFDGRVEDYYRLVKVAYQTLKSVNPEARVYLGGLVWWNDIAARRELFLKRYLQVILEDPTAAENDAYLDGVTLNIRLPATPVGGLNITTDAAGDITTTVRDLLAEVGLGDKAIWVALGASPTADPVGGLPGAAVSITPEQQADFMIQGTVMALAAGAERVAIFKLYDSNFTPGETEPYGLLRFDNSRRPAFETYRFAVETFGPTLKFSAGRSRNGRLVVLEQAERTVYVMWSAGAEPVNFWLESRFGDQLQLYDSYGNSLPLPRFGVAGDNAPVFVIETPPALAIEAGLVTVSGSPRIAILAGEPRRVWAAVGANAVQLR